MLPDRKTVSFHTKIVKKKSPRIKSWLPRFNSFHDSFAKSVSLTFITLKAIPGKVNGYMAHCSDILFAVESAINGSLQDFLPEDTHNDEIVAS